MPRTRMARTRACTSGSAWRRSTEPGPRSSPPSMYAPPRSSAQPTVLALGTRFGSTSRFLQPPDECAWLLILRLFRFGSCHQEVLRGINLKLFDQVLHWVRESFSAARAVAEPSHTEIQQPYPLLTDVICRRIPTAFVLTSEHFSAKSPVNNCFYCRRLLPDFSLLQRTPSLSMTSQRFEISRTISGPMAATWPSFRRPSCRRNMESVVALGTY
jgi:hypothetical protein